MKILLRATELLYAAALIVGVNVAFAETASATEIRSCIEPRLAQLEVGFTLTHHRVRTDADSECAASPSGGASIDGSNNIIKHYQDPGVRSHVRSMLATMASQGAKIIRTIVWYRHTEDEAMSRRPNDPLGLLIASAGKLPDKHVNNLFDYVSDAKSMGYTRFIVVLSAQGRSNPKCKRLEWGDCYTDEYLGLTWSVTSQVVRALRNPVLSGIDVIFDISPEACFPPVPKLLVDKNLEAYSRFMIQNYRDSFGDKKFISSCGVGNVDRAMQGLAGQVALYKELKVQPGAIDLHVYDTDAAKVKNLLIKADQLAHELRVPLDIAETYYDHPNIFGTISALLSSNALGTLREILVFPRKNKSACQIGVSPPYSIERVDSHLQRRNSFGQRAGVCAKD